MTEINTILVVEDDKLARRMLRETLENDDFLVIEAAFGERAFDVIEHHPVDLILMDLNLPDGCGLEFIKRLKQKIKTPIIVLSGEENNSKKVECFEIGAEDFVSKPYNDQLLKARIKSHIRRSNNLSSLQNINENDNTPNIKIKDWTIDSSKYQLFNKNLEPADLTSREFKLLNFLISNADHALTREELCEAVREDNYIPTPRALDVKITRIRKKIGDDASNPKIIVTVRGVGYMFNKNIIENVNSNK